MSLMTMNILHLEVIVRDSDTQWCESEVKWAEAKEPDKVEGLTCLTDEGMGHRTGMIKPSEVLGTQ